jgi:hypothetical protein
MSSQMSSFRRQTHDHFQPEADLDPGAQRALRGKLEQIDYIAYLSSREVIGQALAEVDVQKLQRLAVAAAHARAQWASLALAITEASHLPNPKQIETLADMRTAYEELAAAYDGMRRMVERGYLAYKPSAKPLR